MELTTIPNAQQANILQLHFRDAALLFFQTLPVATRESFELSIIALRDRFCYPQLGSLHVLELENLKFHSKTDTPMKLLVTLHTKAMKTYPDPILASNSSLLHLTLMQQMLPLSELGLMKIVRVVQK